MPSLDFLQVIYIVEVRYMDEKLNEIKEENIKESTDNKTDTKPPEKADTLKEKEALPIKKKKIIKRVILALAGLIIGIPLTAIIIAGCIFGFDTVGYVLKPDNIKAFINSMRYSQEDIELKIEENHQRMEEVVEENPLIDIRGGLTEEETQALAEGKITPEQAVQIVKGELTLDEALSGQGAEAQSTPDTPANGEEVVATDGTEATAQDGNVEVTPDNPKTDTGKTSTKPSTGKTGTKSGGKTNTGSNPGKTETKPSSGTTTTPPKEEAPKDPAVDKVSTLISELYVVQADCLAKLEAMGDQAYAEYVATGYDRSQIDTIVNNYTSTAGAMEIECDKKVNSIVKELRAAIKEANGDMSLAKEVTNYYYNEKSLKKTYYINKIKGEDYK